MNSRILLLASITMFCAITISTAQSLREMSLSLTDKWRQLGSSIRHDESEGPLGVSMALHASEDSLAEMNRQALRAFERGELKHADSIFKSIRNMVRARPGRRANPDLAIALTNFGLFKYAYHDDSSNAHNFLTEARDIREKICGGAPDPEFARSLVILGAFYFNHGRLDSASVLLRRAMTVYEHLDTSANRAGLAECLLDHGILLEAVGDHVGADARFNEVLALWGHIGPGDMSGLLPLAHALEFIASIKAYRGDYVGAERLLADGLSARRHFYGGMDHNEVTSSLASLAFFHAGRGDLAGADSLYGLAVDMARRLAGDRDDSMLARLLGEQGDARLRDGDVMGALRLFRESVEQYRRLYARDSSLEVELARNLVRLGNAMIRSGDYISPEEPFREAWEYYKRAGYLRSNRSEHASSLQGLGLVFNYAGEYHHAGVDFYHAMRMFRDLFNRRNDPGLASCLAEVGNVYRARGWFVRAESLLVASVEIYRCLDEGFPDAGRARALGYLGRYHQDKGDTARAGAYFDSSLAIRRRIYHGSNPHDLVEGLRELSAFRAELGDTVGAEKLLIEAMGLLGGRGRSSEMDLALTESLLGRLYLMSGDYRTAQPYVEDAYGIYTRVSNGHEHPELAHSIRDMAILRSYQGEKRSADSLFVAATGMYTRLFYAGFQLDPVEGLDAIGRFAEWHGDSARAHLAFDSLLAILPKVTRQMSLTDGEEGQINLQKRLTAVSHSMMSYFLRQRSAGDLFNASLWLKGRILSAVQWRNDVLRELGDEDREIDDVRRQYVQARRFLSSTRSALDSAELDLWVRARAETLAISNRLEDRLARKSATLARSRQRTTWKTIRDNLKGNTRVIEYIRIPYVDRWGSEDSVFYCAVIVRPERQLPTLVTLCEERSVSDILHYVVGDRNTDKQSYIWDGARRVDLHRLVWSPIDSLLRGADTVYISPDGFLNQIAFAPLTDGTPRMLLDRYTLRYLFSARDLVARGPVPPDAHPEPPSAGVFGGIDYEVDPVTWRHAVQSAGSSPRSVLSALENYPFPLPLARTAKAALPPLAGTKREAEKTASILSRHDYKVGLYTGARATEEAFLGLSSPTVLHVATHGYCFAPSELPDDESEGVRAMGGIGMLEYADDPLLRSGLLLAGANRAWTHRAPVEGVADGIVSAFDVAHMDLGRTSLVVLSACETGLGELRQGEGVFGMKRAFRAAGAATVVMSLWKVPDEATQRLMELFYTNWLDKRMAKADAFIAAQRTMAATDGPYYWAGFVLVGE